MYGSPSASIRVPIAPRARIEPPIPLPASFLTESVLASSASIDTSLEQRIVAEGQTSLETATTSTSHAKDAGVSALTEMGYDRACSSLACAYQPSQGGRITEKSVNFANGVKLMTEMGHPLSIAVGALLRANCDVNKAAEIASTAR